ncbi:MAG: FtsX-like permease family protein [Oscillospiraceae bacterium]|nr:FtsX-like permease family protein [Oscillospiraceae bacterium]
MAFEGKLARRYISAQKRHSILTVCSIAIAAAMMTMIFVLAQTMLSSQRAHIVRTDFPHHYVVCSPHAFTQAQLDQLRADPAVKDCGTFDPEEFWSMQQNKEGTTRYTPESTAAAVWNYYHQIDGYSERDLKELELFYAAQQAPGDKPLSRAEVLEKAGIAVPDPDAKPVWIDYKFKWKEADNAQYQPISALIGDVSGCRVFPNYLLMKFDYIGIEGKYSMALLFSLIFVLVILLAMCLRMVIDTAFEISSKERERQFGVLQSVGATRKQAVRIITHEAGLLSLIGLPIGLALGTGLAYLTYRMVLATKVIRWRWGTDGLLDVSFRVGIVSLAAAALTGALWVFLSAYGTGMRMLKKKAPIETIRASQSQIKKVKKHSVFGLLFGWVGNLAAKNVRRSKKRFIVTLVSLAASITLIASVTYASDAYRNISTLVVAEANSYTGIINDLEIKGIADDDSDASRAALVKELEETGYFEHVRPLCETFGKVKNEKAQNESKTSTVVMLYLNEKDYNRFFDGKPEMSYEEFRQHGGYALLNGGRYHYKEGDLPIQDGKLTLTVMKIEPLTEEQRAEAIRQYEEEHQNEPDHPEKYFIDYCTGWNAAKKEPIYTDAQQQYNEVTLSVFGPLTVPDGNAAVDAIMEANGFRIIAPLDEYEAISHFVTKSADMTIMADIRDDNTYDSAVSYLKSDKRFNINQDSYAGIRILESGVSAFDTTVRMLCILISLIAVVSMINVITTGILNRRAELAGMRAVGMTGKQMRGLMLCECVQFVIGGILGAIAATSAAIFGMRSLVNEIGLPELADQLGLTYTKPIPMILIAGVCALAVALIATVIPLRRMEKEPIVDSLRAFD